MAKQSTKCEKCGKPGTPRRYMQGGKSGKIHFSRFYILCTACHLSGIAQESTR